MSDLFDRVTECSDEFQEVFCEVLHGFQVGHHVSRTLVSCEIHGCDFWCHSLPVIRLTLLRITFVRHDTMVS